MGKKPRDFNQIPKEINQLKPGAKMSARIPDEDLIPIPGDLCDHDLTVPGVINLLPGRRGREEGSTKIYTPDQTYNYLSVSERDEKSLELIPAYTKENDNTKSTTYGFCSSGSPSGFWEVSVEPTGTATFIEFDPPFLTILCPRPFVVSELTTLSSDSTTYKWTQISGSRTVLITPDDTKDPTINIITTCIEGTGCSNGTQNPIRLRVETDNELIFTDLIILNRATDNFDGLGYSGEINYVQIDCRRVKSVIRVPTGITREWDGSPLQVTWLPPTCDLEFLQGFTLQKLIPPYQPIASIPVGQNIATIEVNTQYRIDANFLIYGRQELSTSEPLIIPYDATAPIKTVFTDDQSSGIGFTSIRSSTSTDVPVVQVRSLEEASDIGLGFTSIYSSASTNVPGVQVRLLAEDVATSLGYSVIASSYIITDLGGIVIG